MKTLVNATADNLSEIMNFDHPIQVLEDGAVTDDLPNEYAPEFYVEVDSDGQCVPQDDSDIFEQARAQGWKLLTGFTGQYGYNGPVMHASEFIGGGLARYILKTPGIYVSVVVESEDTDGEQQDTPIGWLIAYKQ